MEPRDRASNLRNEWNGDLMLIDKTQPTFGLVGQSSSQRTVSQDEKLRTKFKIMSQKDELQTTTWRNQKMNLES